MEVLLPQGPRFTPIPHPPPRSPSLSVDLPASLLSPGLFSTPSHRPFLLPSCPDLLNSYPFSQTRPNSTPSRKPSKLLSFHRALGSLSVMIRFPGGFSLLNFELLELRLPVLRPSVSQGSDTALGT